MIGGALSTFGDAAPEWDLQTQALWEMMPPRSAVVTLGLTFTACHAAPEPGPTRSAQPALATSQSASSVAASPASTRAKPTTTFTLRGTTYTLGKDRSFPSCEQPEAWLAFVRRDELLEPFCARCTDSTWCQSGGEPWSFTMESGPTDGFWCNELKYLRYEIGAELGLSVPPGRFLPYFAYRRDYRPDDSLVEADLPAAARENLAFIDEHLARCNGSKLEVTVRDEKVVDDWFRANYMKTAPLPKKLTDNCKRISESEFRSMMRRSPYVGFSPRTPITREASRSCDLPIPEGGRLLSVHVGAWLTAERCTECEEHNILEMMVDANDRIVALGAFL
jgi:hypothetical protein